MGGEGKRKPTIFMLLYVLLRRKFFYGHKPLAIKFIEASQTETEPDIY